jgi:hypothetical protein
MQTPAPPEVLSLGEQSRRGPTPHPQALRAGPQPRLHS